MNGKQFHISIAMIDWIAEQQGLSVAELAQRIMVKSTDKFEKGIVNKTQAGKLAKLANIPFGFLFLKHPPPAQKATLPDFRNVVDSLPLSNDFFDTLNDIQSKIEWYQDYLARQGDYTPLAIVGKYKPLETPVDIISDDIRKLLHLDNINLEKTSKGDYLKIVIERIENAGVLVFQNGVVGANNKRSIDIAEFRGFAIADRHTPAIFLNNNDSKSAQLFTLIHELAHILTGAAGISNWTYPFTNKVESYCNKVASMVLMPTDAFLKMWRSNNDINTLSNYFKTSELSVAIKAHELGLIEPDRVNKIREDLNNFLAREKKKQNGGVYYHNIPIRNSRKLTRTIINDTLNQNTTLSEAGRLLHVKPKAIMTGVL